MHAFRPTLKSHSAAAQRAPATAWSTVATTTATTARMEFYGYSDCTELLNKHARVIITPHGGCRVLLYALTDGPNAIHLDHDLSLGPHGKWESGDAAAGDEQHPGWKWGGDRSATGDPFGPSGGRFDVGPEFQSSGPDLRQGGHPALFFGSWELVGGAPGADGTAAAATMQSGVCKYTGLQLTRRFELASDSAELTVAQTMRNAGDAPSLRVNHWGRTFVPGGGIAIVPLPPDGYSRFPNKFVTYAFGSAEGGHAILFEPSEPDSVRVRDNFVEVTAQTRMRHEKIGMDSTAGWMAYISRAGTMLTKHFAVHPERVYGEMAGLTCCVFYYRDRLVELEPIGPLENLGPGEEACFVEHWNLLPMPFPAEGMDLDLQQVSELVAESCSSAGYVPIEDASHDLSLKTRG